MLAIWGSKRQRFCDGISRRDFLRVGGLGTAGITLPDLFHAQAQGSGSSNSRPGKTRACIFIILQGGPPHLDTFDLKPDAPAEIRGEFRPIATNVLGINIGEHLPLLARHTDKCVLIRSVHNNGFVTNEHGDAFYLTLTGHRYPRQVPDGTRTSDVRPDHYPFIGSGVSYLRPASTAMPTSVFLTPEKLNSGVGGTASFLGKKYEPFMVERDPNAGPFTLEAMALPADTPAPRLEDRRQLLEQIDRQAGAMLPAMGQMQAHYERAFNLLGTTLASRAFDIAAEPAKLRDRYRRHMFGQSVLLARRLVEHGVPLVTVRWNGSPELPNNSGWDMHANNHKSCKVLLPIVDQVISALLEDLSTRGLLDETLVVLTGEFGRTPKINKDAGRDHWGHCYSMLLAGGGTRGGTVYGASDKNGAYPREKPIGTSDVVATMYHYLGIAPDTEIPDQLGRKVRLCQGDVVEGLFA
jgi:hypothetical protein